MSEDMSAVRHNEELNRYELSVDGQVAVADYTEHGDVLAFTHTGVPKALEGRGIASKLIKGALADVRARGKKVRPLCSFVEAYFKRHADEADLLET